MSDIAGPSSPHLDTGEVRHTMTIYDVERALEQAGVGRSHRQVIRYCETGMLDAVKVPGPTGDQWFVSPASVPKAIADLKQWDTQRASRGAPQQAVSESVRAIEPNKTEADAASLSVPHPAVSHAQDKDKEGATGNDKLRHAMSDLDIYEHPYVKRLEERNEKLEAKYEAQVRRTEEIQLKGQEKLLELQRMIAVGQSQTLADFMLKAKDWMLGPSSDSENREVRDAPPQT